MARSRSSARWLREHFADDHVKRARREGYRSRAVYKLKEIQERDRLLRPGMTVVDLGAAPGGWSQLAAEYVGPRGRVVALDILPMAALPGVEFLQGDFHEATALQQLLEQLADCPVDLVTSDMSPNISGIKAVDQPRGMHLAELALEFATQVLRPGGDFLSKVFQGEGFDAFIRNLRQHFASVATRKPRSSRSRSPELYVLARNHRS